MLSVTLHAIHAKEVVTSPSQKGYKPSNSECHIPFNEINISFRTKMIFPVG